MEEFDAACSLDAAGIADRWDDVGEDGRPMDGDAKMDLCQQILGYRFQNRRLLRSCLTHSSGASNRLGSNERLEFLGDAVLGLIVCRWLYDEYPHFDEGELTRVKSAVVSRRSCAKIAARLGLDRCLIVGRGVGRNRSFPRSLVSDVFESVIGAIYLDGGIEAAEEQIRDWMREEVRGVIEDAGEGNHKSVFQQAAQRDLGATPMYQLVGQSGPDHRKMFRVRAVVGPRRFPAAEGFNKKIAQQRAAANALAELAGDPVPHPCDDDRDGIDGRNAAGIARDAIDGVTCVEADRDARDRDACDGLGDHRDGPGDHRDEIDGGGPKHR